MDREGDGLRGSGPDLEPGLATVEVGPWGVLHVLREGAGPMRVDVATGDRAVLSQSADPPVGEGVVLREPVTGNRRLISQDVAGEDLGLLSANARFVGYAAPRIPRLPRALRRRAAPF